MVFLQSRHPLAESGSLGIEMPGPTHLELVDGARIFSIQPFKARSKSIEQRLKRAKTVSLRRVGPEDWLAVVDDRLPEIDASEALVVDQSHGRTLFRLKGPDAVAILMKGVGVDIQGSGFPVGASANMLFGHVGINLARLGESAFELIVMRSYAESLSHDLRLAGREFSLTFAVSDR